MNRAKASVTPEAISFAPADDVMEMLQSVPGIDDNLPERTAAHEQMEREHRIGLASIRSAAQLTQEEVARKLGVGQTSVSRLEGRDDMLLSTLKGYLDAVGAEAVITIRIGDSVQRVSLAELV